MSYAVIPLLTFRKKKDWKAMNVTPGKEYPVWVYRGHGLYFTDNYQPMTIANTQMKRAKRNKDFLYKLIQNNKRS